MELERCRALVRAIDLGSLTAAAQDMGYTPSGVSRMVAALEGDLGVSLLLRSKEGVRPTGACVQLLPHIRELLFCGQQVDQLAAQLRELDVGELTIGTAYSSCYPWLSQVTSDFRQCYPGVRVKLVSGYSSQLVEQIRDRQVDAAILSQREGEHRWEPLWEDPLLVMVPPDHPLAAGEAVPLSALGREPYIDTYPGQDVDNRRLFRRLDITPNTQCATMDILATYAMVETGLGISLCNRENSGRWQGRVVLLPLDPPQTVTIGLASAQRPSPAAQRFLQFVRPYLPELHSKGR